MPFFSDYTIPAHSEQALSSHWQNVSFETFAQLPRFPIFGSTAHFNFLTNFTIFFLKIEQSFSFADIALNKNADRNRSMHFLRKVNKTIDWKPVEKFLKEYYQIGKSKERERAYSPFLLFKCLLLQNWFQIKSDPELENLICDRLSFRDFLKLPMDYPSPDHSTFSRFRKNLSKEVMIKVNSEILKQFHQHGISINKGVAVDARLVKSASKPISKKQMKELKAHLDTPKSRLDKNSNLKKFSRDFESDWTINLKVTRKNDKPHYGFKEHTSVDTENGFILSTTLSPSSSSRHLFPPILKRIVRE
jgi:transposase, IS5 family